jgi:hypothetical protein
LTNKNDEGLGLTKKEWQQKHTHIETQPEHIHILW